MALSIDTSRSTLIQGIVNVSGAFEVWLVGGGDTCGLFGYLSHEAFPCPVAIYSGPVYCWNMSFSSGGPLDLSKLRFGLSSTPNELPPQWGVLTVVDSQTTPETAVAESTLQLVTA